jgi:signal transduction histidine kinase/CheY-like chemotaxis protein
MALANVHPDDVPIVLAGRQRAVEADEPMRYEYRGRAPAPDGRPRWFSTTGRVLRDEAGRPVRIVAVTTDITERRRAEAEREELDRQLREAQRWESLGVLAGGVAHDFNNILAAIQGAAGLARRGLPPGSPAQAHLDQIEQGCGRAANVCRQMLAYAGHARSAGGATDLAALVRESVPLLEIPAGPAAVKLELGANIPPVPVDPAHVRQVLVGLATNAAEALGGGAGTVTVGARLAEVLPGGSDVGFQIAPAPGRYAVLTVSDTGCGMAPDVRARMFDPFFTTKFPGRGLGLAAVLGIVRTHGGGLHVATAPGRGTIVSAYWPLPAGAAPPPPPVPSTAAALVIDDEMYVREVTASALQEMGYSPLLAADGPSGVELFRRHRDVIKVAVIDAVMPGMSGEQVLESLREMDPALPAVLVSALADRRAARSSGARTAFVLKPFHPEELMEAVRRLA